MSEHLPVAGYYRVSVARDNMHSPNLYEDEIRRYCTYRQLTLARIYSDVDYSAFRGAKERPSLKELIDDRKSYSAIIIPKLSRFGRSMKQLVKLFEIFDNDDIPLVFLDMNLDTSTSQGRLLRHILAAFAEYESDVKADYTRATHRRVRAEGRPWGSAPYGYRKGDQPSTWVIDEETGPIVAGIFSDYAEGFSANGIARFLNDAGVASPKNVRWKGQRIGMILDNPIYAGLTQLDDSFVEAQWEGIVGPGLWNTVRERRAADPRRMHNLGRAKPKQRYLLTGFIYCGLCGSKMTHTRNQRDGRGVYHCAGETWGQWTGCRNMRVPEYLADPIVEEQFLARCAFTILTEAGSRAGSPRHLWAEASLEERRRLLGLVVERVVMTPLDFEVPRMKRGMTLGHEVRVVWQNDVADRDEVVIVADPPQPVEQVVRNTRVSRLRETERTTNIAEPDSSLEPVRIAPKSWAEHRRERLLPR